MKESKREKGGVEWSGVEEWVGKCSAGQCSRMKRREMERRRVDWIREN